MPEVRVRVGVVVLRGDEVLLVEHEKGRRRYWLLPGGGVEAGETLAEAAAREVREECGLEVDVGRLVVVCESIEPRRFGTRHLVHLVFAGRVRGGALRPEPDGRVVDAAWAPRAALADLEIYPAIGAELAACVEERLEGELRLLGNVWRPGD